MLDSRDGTYTNHTVSIYCGGGGDSGGGSDSGNDGVGSVGGDGDALF